MTNYNPMFSYSRILSILLVIFLLPSNVISAGSESDFYIRRGLILQKADSIASVFSSLHPEIKHFKESYKIFYDRNFRKKVSLDMFLEIPAGKGPFPVAVFVHGGGFVHGDKSAFIPQTFALAREGIAAVTIEYRLYDQGGTKDTYLADVMDAIAFLRKNASAYKLDFSRLALAGGSAGGYLSAMVAMKTPECICYVGYNGVFDLRGKTYPGFPENPAIEDSPLFAIRDNPPETLLFHGKADNTVLPEVSGAFAEAVRKQGGKAKVILYDGQKHAFFNKEPYLSETTEEMVKFVRSVLSTRPDTIRQARWISYPGEFGIWTHKELMSRRTERNVPVPTSLSRIDAPYGIIRFDKRIKLEKPERASLYADGKFYIRGIGGGGIMYDYDPTDFELPAGDYTISVLVENYSSLPSLYFKSDSYVSDETWKTSSLNADWTHAETLDFEDPELPPSGYKLDVKPLDCSIVERDGNSTLYDFGKETFAFPVLRGLKGSGKINLFYGESKEEALAGKLAETWDELDVASTEAYQDTLPAKAFRYVRILTDGTVTYQGFSGLYEFLPLSYRGTFRCSDDLLNRIYDMSYYTLHLCTREVHIDGIKRDRWAWSGDAYQSYLMNFYTFFDEDVNKRTLWGLRGHEPQTRHLNSILDYSFYWMIGIYDHYLYTGDADFVKQIYPRMKSTLDFCMSRLNQNGMAEGLKTDWVFVDWAPIDKKGELSFEQLLFIKSLDAVRQCALLAGDQETKTRLERVYSQKLKQFDDVFWSDEKEAYVHNRVEGVLSDDVTRYSNMFAVLFNIADEKQKQQIRDHVLLNDSVLAITTPYMKFYELAALCEIGEYRKVLDFVRTYWGGMLKLGATSVWETFDPSLPDTAHYSMYGRPFGKSLCHAWGGNPVYLFGRYYLGVYPTVPGYKEYVVEPNLGDLKWIEGTVPTPDGDIKVSVTPKTITVRTAKSTGGVLIFASKKKPEISEGVLEGTGNGRYRLKLNKAHETFSVKLK